MMITSSLLSSTDSHLISVKFDGLKGLFFFVLLSFLHRSITSLLKSAELVMQSLSSQLPSQDRGSYISAVKTTRNHLLEEERRIRREPEEGSIQTEKASSSHVHTTAGNPDPLLSSSLLPNEERSPF
jgi:hypothetical protein